MISVAIMAHPKRAAQVEGLQEKLPSATVVWDERNDRWDTGSRSLLAYDPDATHHVVIQDDAILCRHLLRGIEHAIAFSGDHPVSLYTGRTRPHQRFIVPAVARARERGASWLVTEGPIWGVGLVIPTAHIDELVEWGNRNPYVMRGSRIVRLDNYDLRIGAWYELQDIDCWYTVPSLVDHRGDEESLVPGRWSNTRFAHWFIGEDESALSVDWSRQQRLRWYDVRVVINSVGTFRSGIHKFGPGEQRTRLTEIELDVIREGAPDWVDITVEEEEQRIRDELPPGIGFAIGGGTAELDTRVTRVHHDGDETFDMDGFLFRPGVNEVTDRGLVERLRREKPSFIRIEDDLI